MTVLARSALEASPLADLHAIASELSIDGYRRLRRPALIDAILDRQEGGEAAGGDELLPESAETTGTFATEDAAEAGRGRGTARRRRATADRAEAAADPAEATADPAEATADSAEATADPAEATADSAEATADRAEAAAETEVDDGERAATTTADADEDDEGRTGRRRRGRRGGRGRSTSRDEAEAAADTDEDQPAEESEATPADEELVEGVVELLANGSGFVRVDPPDPSDEDVYISSAQVKRCELVSGDRVAGPKRAPRRSERFASLIRIETINGRPAAELADSVRFDDLPAAFPSERLELASDDPTLKAIEWLTPFGKGSRVTIVGRARAGKTEALRRLAETLAGRDGLTLSVVLAGVRPEEIAEWNAGPVPPSAAVTLGASEDARNGAIEPAIDQARRLAARGADAVVLIDTLDGCSPALARKALAAARNIVDGGSLTIVATASAPVGGESTVIALDEARASLGRFPALDLAASGTIRAELLVGDAGADAIRRTRADAVSGR